MANRPPDSPIHSLTDPPCGIDLVDDKGSEVLGPTFPKKASLETVVSMRQRGLSLSEIGKVVGVSKQAVSQMLKRSGIDIEAVETFKKGKPLILHAKQKMLLDQITPAEVKKMSGRDLAVSFGILFDKTQLLEGRATANVASLMRVLTASDPDEVPEE